MTVPLRALRAWNDCTTVTPWSGGQASKKERSACNFLRRVTVLVAVATISVLGSVVPAHAADGDASDGGSSGDVSARGGRVVG